MYLLSTKIIEGSFAPLQFTKLFKKKIEDIQYLVKFFKKRMEAYFYKKLLRMHPDFFIIIIIRKVSTFLT